MSSEYQRLAASRIEEAAEGLRRMLDEDSLAELEGAAQALVAGFRGGGKLLTFGNGGSAEAAQHVAAELVGRFRLERRAFPAIALVESFPILTAVANDSSFAEVFSRQLEGLGRPGDMVLALSTSGRSENVLQAVQAARAGGMTTIAMTGPDPSPVGEAAELCLRFPGTEAARVQECHLVATHVLCEIVERELS